MKLPNAHLAMVPQAKLKHYLLSLDHPHGGPKARLFVGCGFSPDRPELLRWALLNLATRADVAETVQVRHGTKYVVDGAIRLLEEVRSRSAPYGSRWSESTGPGS